MSLSIHDFRSRTSGHGGTKARSGHLADGPRRTALLGLVVGTHLTAVSALPVPSAPLALALSSLAFADRSAQARTPEEVLQGAQDSFLFGDYDAAAAEALRLIERGELPPALLREAHVLAAQCYLELGAEEAVDAAICAAHAVDPLWQPSSTVFTEREVIRFAAALRACPEVPARRAPGPDTSLGNVPGATPGTAPGAALGASPAAPTPSQPTTGATGAADATLSSALADSSTSALAAARASTPWFRRPLSWVVGGAAAVGVAVLALGSGGTGDPGRGPDPGNTEGMGDFPAAPED